MGWGWVFSSDFTDTCACESFTASGSVRSLSSDVVVLRDELGSLEGIESNRSAADSFTNVVIWWRVCHFKCNLFTYEALRSTEELVERVRAFQIELEFGNVFEERRKLGYPEKNLSELRRELTTNSTLIWRRPGPHWWEANVLITWSTKNFKGLCQASCYLFKRVRLLFTWFQFPK